MKIEVSNGEIVDKLTILQIKKINITESEKLINVEKELNYLIEINHNIKINDFLYEELFDVNKKLWDVEEHIRKKENKKEFDDEFVNLARNVYILNDKRAEIKKRINTITNSNFIEEKSY
jgi:hypothetical protein